ncbi:alcohol dehydrogenase [Lineolata rhizophorae]|uniref:Alcohol dehydrogenase n=1 Tax=Lineolata rhizophorae TaxID=578093 RepID=A0A6A6NWT7_9PEZI|nr:alcohol dehydrogenase [Lineolata rhizophorae]
MPSAISIRQVPGKPGQVYYPLERISLPTPDPGPTQAVVRLSAAALNHRDLFIRQHLYPGTTFGVPLLADGCGVVESAGSALETQRWVGRRVVLNPGTGWRDAPEGPEGPKGYAILGGTKANAVGTLAETAVVDAAELEEAPAHLSDAEAAALPLTGLTAFRAVFTKSGNATPGRNVLITGIGGGVALMALVFLVAVGANVFVSSGSEEKIRRALEMGAKGGVNYKEEGWEKTLLSMLPKERSTLDAIIDGAGGDVVEKGAKLLKQGGVIVSYGMTLGPKMPFMMTAVLKNIDLRGSTMGSRKEFAEMIKFTNENKLHPVISRVVQGMDNIDALDSLFEDMKKGSQFGKLVIQITKESDCSKL